MNNEEKKFKLTADDIVKKTDFFNTKVPFMHRKYTTKAVMKLSAIFISIIVLISSAFIFYAAINPLNYNKTMDKNLLKSERSFINTICEIEKEEVYESIVVNGYFIYIYEIESTTHEINYFYRFVSTSQKNTSFTITTKYDTLEINEEYYFGIYSLNKVDSFVEIMVSYQDNTDKYLITKSK